MNRISFPSTTAWLLDWLQKGNCIAWSPVYNEFIAYCQVPYPDFNIHTGNITSAHKSILYLIKLNKVRCVLDSRGEILNEEFLVQYSLGTLPFVRIELM